MKISTIRFEPEQYDSLENHGLYAKKLGNKYAAKLIAKTRQKRRRLTMELK